MKSKKEKSPATKGIKFNLSDSSVKEIKDFIESAPGCVLHKIDFEDHKASGIQSGKLIYSVSVEFYGWSPSLFKAKIRRGIESDLSKINDIIDQENIVEKVKTQLQDDVERQRSRASLAKSMGIKIPNTSTGLDINEISHLEVDRTLLDIFTERYGTQDRVMKRICEIHHKAHKKSENYENYLTISEEVLLSDGYQAYVIIYQDDNRVCISIGDMLCKTTCGSDENFKIYLMLNSFYVPHFHAPETITTSLIGNPVKNLIVFNRPVDNRIIKNIIPGRNKDRIEIEDDWVSVSSIIDKIGNRNTLWDGKIPRK
jgi:hypothetical protein